MSKVVNLFLLKPDDQEAFVNLVLGRVRPVFNMAYLVDEYDCYLGVYCNNSSFINKENRLHFRIVPKDIGDGVTNAAVKITKKENNQIIDYIEKNYTHIHEFIEYKDVVKVQSSPYSIDKPNASLDFSDEIIHEVSVIVSTTVDSRVNPHVFVTVRSSNVNGIVDKTVKAQVDIVTQYVLHKHWPDIKFTKLDHDNNLAVIYDKIFISREENDKLIKL